MLTQLRSKNSIKLGNQTNMFQKIVNKFCSNTNLHGFSYITQQSRQKVEKIFWISSILISLILTGILIIKLVQQSQKNPVIIYMDQNTVNVEQTLFPAVTICPGLTYKSLCMTIIDYENLKIQLLSHKKNISNLSVKELKLLQAASLIARDNFLSDNFPSHSIPTNDFMEVLSEFNLTFDTGYHYGNVYRKYETVQNFISTYGREYAVFFKEVWSNIGPCYTFNFPSDPQEFYQNM